MSAPSGWVCLRSLYLFLGGRRWCLHWLLGLSGGKGYVKKCVRGGCGLRKTLGSQSAGGWGCVLFVVWVRYPGLGTYGLLGGARSWCQNGRLQNTSHNDKKCSSISVTSVFVPIVNQNHPISPGDPSRPAGKLSLRLLKCHWFFLGPGANETFYMHSTRVEFLFLPVLWSFGIKHHWPSKTNALGLPPLDARPLDCEAWCGTQNSQTCGENLIPLFFPVCGSATGVGFDCIKYMPLLLSSLSLDVEYLFR